MAAGLNHTLTRTVVDELVGTTAAAVNAAMQSVLATKAFLDVQDDAALEALGYEPDEIAVMRSAYVDLAKLYQVYVGAAEQTPAYDARTFAQRVWGTGGVVPGH